MTVAVIGAGLAGVEAAHTLAAHGVQVRLHEMKPQKFSPAHTNAGFAELVCSNSLKADRLTTAGGLLKAEMRLLSKAGSLTLDVAEQTKVPAGGALAVDRAAFSDEITRRITANPNIEVISGEVTEFPQSNAVIATGPLTSDTFAETIRQKCGGWLSFYDAAAPIVTADSIDMNRVFPASRYDKGDADYLNCPFTREEYELFYNALITAEVAPLHDFDKVIVYEGCMPVEVLAKRGIDAVRYGCMKPVGLTDPRTGRRPYAAVQLRKENSAGTMFNLVGFQTNLKFGEQKRVFSLIPGLENAEFVRYGVMHRNTFINSPKLLDSSFKLRESDNLYFAGQITGVEGYMESAASGIVAALAIAGKLPKLPRTTMLGALTRYVSDESVLNYQPMGANMGLLPPLDRVIKNKQERYEALAELAIADLKAAIADLKGTL
jgi:methylenetetrahydrofolate--tRNA-(uracil-5-)-methyltransferase